MLFLNISNILFQIILSRNWQGQVISQLRKEGPKELCTNQFVFHLMIFNLKWSYKIQQCLLGKAEWKRLLLAKYFKYSFLWNRYSSITIKKSNISINFEQKLVRSCNFPITKRRTKGAPGWANFCLLFHFWIWSDARGYCNAFSKIR